MQPQLSAPQIIQRGIVTESSFVSAISALCLPSPHNLADVEIRCQDGVVSAHQAILSHHSSFLRDLFLARQTVELQMGPASADSSELKATYLGARKDDMVTLVLADFQRAEVLMLVALLYAGEYPVRQPSQLADALSRLWRALRIDSFQRQDLQVQVRPVPNSVTDHLISPLAPPPRRDPSEASPIEEGMKAYRKKPRPKAGKTTNRRPPAQDGQTRSPPSQARTGPVVKRLASLPPQRSPAQAEVYECEFCDKIIQFKSWKTGLQFNAKVFLTHTLTHLVETQYADLPNLSAYHCPYPGCLKKKFSLKRYFLFHLAKNHQEFILRIERRLRELKLPATQAPNFNVKIRSDEENKLKRIVYFYRKKIDDLASDRPISLFRDSEAEIFRHHEKRSTATKRVECLLCNSGEASFKSDQFAVLHYFLEHASKHLDGIATLTERQDCRQFMPQYKCGFDEDCQFGSSLRTELVMHLGHSHGYFQKLSLQNLMSGLNLETSAKREKLVRFKCCSTLSDYQGMLEHFGHAHAEDRSILVQCSQCQSYLNCATPDMFKKENHVCSQATEEGLNEINGSISPASQSSNQANKPLMALKMEEVVINAVEGSSGDMNGEESTVDEQDFEPTSRTLSRKREGNRTAPQTAQCLKRRKTKATTNIGSDLDQDAEDRVSVVCLDTSDEEPSEDRGS
eukprot:maker-scaffold153_size302544-snap-gene-2.19 protein:Tk03379 transcript:maker-scaffold153_size302544-snap-gene-2.19-mRNA-1 annotation:"membrane protein"